MQYKDIMIKMRLDACLLKLYNKEKKNLEANIARVHKEGENTLIIITFLKVKGCIIVITMMITTNHPLGTIISL